MLLASEVTVGRIGPLWPGREALPGALRLGAPSAVEGT